MRAQEEVALPLVEAWEANRLGPSFFLEWHSHAVGGPPELVGVGEAQDAAAPRVPVLALVLAQGGEDLHCHCCLAFGLLAAVIPH